MDIPFEKAFNIPRYSHYDDETILQIPASTMKWMTREAYNYRNAMVILEIELAVFNYQYNLQQKTLAELEKGKMQAEAALAVMRLEADTRAKALRAVEEALQKEAAKWCDEERKRSFKVMAELHSTKIALNKALRERHQFEDKVRELSAKIDAMSPSAELPEACNAQSQAGSSDLEKKLQAATAELETTRGKLREAYIANEKLDVDMDKLEEALAQCTASILNLERKGRQEAEEAARQVASLTARLESCQRQLCAAFNERDAARKASQDMAKKCADLQSDLDGVKRKLEQAKESALEAETQAREEMCQLMDDKFALRDKVRSLEEEVAKGKAKLEKAQEEALEAEVLAREEFTQLMDEKYALREKVQALEAQLAEGEAQTDAVQSRAAEEVATLLSDKFALEDKVQALEQALVEAECQRTEGTPVLKALEEKLEGAENELQQLRSRVLLSNLSILVSSGPRRTTSSRGKAARTGSSLARGSSGSMARRGCGAHTGRLGFIELTTNGGGLGQEWQQGAAPLGCSKENLVHLVLGQRGEVPKGAIHRQSDPVCFSHKNTVRM